MAWARDKGEIDLRVMGVVPIDIKKEDVDRFKGKSDGFREVSHRVFSPNSKKGGAWGGLSRMTNFHGSRMCGGILPH